MKRPKTKNDSNDSLSLAELPIGSSARIVAIGGASAVPRRMMEMGLVPGAPVTVVRQAPLGDPLEIRVRSCHLAVRRADARVIACALET
ncbi:MAG: hypothetical protein C4334_00525 [Pyrinomonas sp.]|uniref:FeoA family protein n=1 Tax=Pyrinomonas sp. TaxID=2080306 RepID=UPI003321AAB7